MGHTKKKKKKKKKRRGKHVGGKDTDKHKRSDSASTTTTTASTESTESTESSVTASTAASSSASSSALARSEVDLARLADPASSPSMPSLLRLHHTSMDSVLDEPTLDDDDDGDDMAAGREGAGAAGGFVWSQFFLIRAIRLNDVSLVRFVLDATDFDVDKSPLGYLSQTPVAWARHFKAQAVLDYFMLERQVREVAPVLGLDLWRTGAGADADADAHADGDGGIRPRVEMFHPGGFELVPASAVRPGCIVRLQGRESVCPADMMVLRTSTEDNSCYIATPWFDGDARARYRQAVPDLDLPLHVFDRMTCDGELQQDVLERLCFQCGRAVPELDELHVRMGKTKKLQDCLVPAKSTLLLTDWLVGMVVYTGAETKFALNDGERGCEERKAKKKRDKERKKREAEERAERNRLGAEDMRLRAEELERESGVLWTDEFSDVPDDGNCLLHTVWLGLRTLLSKYPELQRPGVDEMLVLSAPTPARFREALFNVLQEDVLYRETLQNLLSIMIEQLEEPFLITMEDFFVLPEVIRDRVLAVKQGLSVCNYDELVDEFIDYAAIPHSYGGGGGGGGGSGSSYVPLGHSEIEALVRVLDIELHTMTSDSVMRRFQAATLHEIDPRAIPLDEINRIKSPYGSASDSGDAAAPARVVRLVNIKSNHYQVHLPRGKDDPLKPPPETNNPTFYDTQYWSRDSFTSGLNLAAEEAELLADE